MYRMIGFDGKEYGPVTLEQLRQWVAEGRAGAQTLVQSEAVAVWRPLAEWTELMPPAAPPVIPPPAMDNGADDPQAGWLRRHFRRHERRRPGAFLWRVTLEGFLVTVAVGIVTALLGVEGREIKPAEFPVLALSAIFIAPWLETLLLQMLPVGVARLCGASRRGQLIAAIILFALPHFFVSVGTGLAAGLVGGFYFAFTYTHWRRQSRARAYWMTVAQHALHNTAAMIIAGVALLAS